MKLGRFTKPPEADKADTLVLVAGGDAPVGDGEAVRYTEKRVRVSQPALTKQIAEIESRCALILFRRDTQTVSVTEVVRDVRQGRIAESGSGSVIAHARQVDPVVVV